MKSSALGFEVHENRIFLNCNIGSQLFQTVMIAVSEVGDAAKFHVFLLHKS